jgi:membrane-bound metal-dependent hydrolase YbcI (DUF457 family)
MPFTFAHPAASVPLRGWLGRYGVVSALVIGSMVPDFSYFMPFPVARWRTHDLFGLLWFCVPMGVASWALFHAFLAKPWSDLLPARLRIRCRALCEMRERPVWTAVVVSIFVGALTHVAWDAFTHAGAPIVRVSRPLRFPLGTISGYPVSVYTILQHVSTLVGLAVVAIWVRRFAARPAPTAPGGFTLGPAGRALALVAVVTVALALWIASGRIVAPTETTLRALQLFLRRAVPAAITASAISLALYAIAWQLLARRAAARGALAV